MSAIKHIPQLMQTECGLCCIAMLSRYYGKYMDLNDLRSYLNPGRDGISFGKLVEILEWQDFECKTYKGNAEILEQIKVPIIIYWENKHYAILEKVKNDVFYVVDPALGRIKYSRSDFEKGFSKMFICAIPGEEFEKKKREKSVWFSYLAFINKPLLFGIIMLSFISYFFTIVFNSFIQNMIDNTGIIKSMTLWIIFGTISGYIMVILVNSLMKVFFNTKLFSDFSKSVYKHLTQIDYAFFEMRSFGNLSFSLESISMVKNLYAEKMVDFIISLGAMVVLILYLGQYSFTIAVMLIVSAILVGLLLRTMSNRVLMLNQLEISGLTKLQEIQSEFIYSIMNIKISGIEDKVYDQWEKQFDYTNEKTKKRDLCQSYYAAAGTLVQTVLPLIILFVLILFKEKIGLTIGQIVAMYSIVVMITSYMVSVFTTMNFFSLSEQYLERVSDITSQKVEESGDKVIDEIDNIKMENVSYRYNDTAPYVIKELSLEIKQGSKVAFVGKSGAGKSTIAKLILGLYKPNEGRILYNNIDMKEIDNKCIRGQCGMVPQDNTLFNKTILENITMGRKDISLEQVKEACRVAEILDEIEDMPMKFNTVISDMGMNVSGGQRQRIILARAVVTQPDVLIFDEATSSLDSVNEQAIYNNIYGKNCTRIIIAHRLSTIVDADCIYVVKDGTIVECGKHDELIKMQGEYSELYKAARLYNFYR